LMTYCLGGLGVPAIGRWNWAVRRHSEEVYSHSI
jgi:hypothetical protein